MGNLNALIAQGGGAPVEMESPTNSLAQMFQLQNAQQNNQLTNLKIQQSQVAQDRQNKLYSVLGGLGANSTIDDHVKALRSNGFIDEADKVQTGELNRIKTQGDANLANAHAGTFNQESIGKALANTATFLPSISTPDSAASYLRGLYADPVLGPMTARLKPLDQAISEIPQDPAGLQQWKIAHANMTPEKFIEITSAKPTEVNSGNSKVFRDTNPNSSTFGQNTAGAAVSIQVSPDTLANNATAVKTTGMNNATSRANNSANINKDYAVAGLNTDGTMNTGSTGSLIDMLGNYQLDPKQALARAPLGQRAALISAVQQKYPGWDETTYDAKKTAANAFTTGQQGIQLNKFATTGEHLDQLLPMIDALKNGDNQTVNKIGNTISKWTGNAAVTNFDAVKSLATKEMMAALVAGGGGEGERNELGSSLANANSSAQLKGVITAYRGMMAAKEDNLMEQRRAAGLSDSTLPKYHRSGDAASSAVPSDIAAILAKHGAK